MALHPNPLTVKFLTGVVQERPDMTAWRAQYIGSSLLPDRQVGGYELTWDVVASENGLAGLYAINGRPVPGSEMLFEQRYSEVKNVMASRVLHPTDVNILREPGEIGISRTGRALAEAAQRKLRDKIAACDDTVDATVEYLRMRSLQGSITWPPLDASGNPITTLQPEWGNVSIQINYPLRTTFQQAATTLTGYNSRAGGAKVWSDTTDGKPLLDLEVIAHLIIETTGLDAHNSTLIMGGEVLSYLAFNASILEWIKGTERGVDMLSTEQVKDYIKTRIGYTIKEYNARWTYRTGNDSVNGPTINSVPFLGRGKVLIIPNGAQLGYLAIAPSPDGKYQSAKYPWIAEDKEPPWETRVGLGLVCLPIPEHYSEIFVFDVFA